jgi:glutathionylspermidine synthase
MALEADITREEAENLKHIRRRRAFFARHPSFWADLNGTEYALFDALALTPGEVADILGTASRLGHLYAKTARLLRQADDDTLRDLGLPENTMAFARVVIPGMPETVIGRFDLVRCERSYKLLEFNSDTPTFVVETFSMNGHVCREMGLTDPNQGADKQLQWALCEAIMAGLRWVGATSDERLPYVVFSSFANHQEDRETTRYLQSLAKGPWDTGYVPLQELCVTTDGLHDAEGRRIDVWYRLYPIEYLARDVDAKTGVLVGQRCMELVMRRRLAVINPPSAFLMQSKAVQAVIWGLHEASSAYFTVEEHTWIERHILPTYMDPAFGSAYVEKPVLGREGDTVLIVDGNTEYASTARSYAGQPMVYQRYISLPQTVVQTESGKKRVSYIHTCFLISGKPAGIGVRAAEHPIIDNAGYFLPCSVTCD